MRPTLEELHANRAQCKQTLEAIFSGPQGDHIKKFIIDELGLHHCLDSNPYKTHYNLGAREAIENLFQLGEK